MSKSRKYHLFDAYGVELEYMIVDRKSLKVKPIAEKIFFEVTGEYTSDVENGTVAWSNELVSHVIEIKCNDPADKLDGLHTQFHENVQQINAILAKHDAMLMPTGAHPTMDPHTETEIWPHEFNEIYSVYNRIFDCRGHGWSNLQSTHINLPFFDDAEFAKLHAAIRVLLPIIPALSASTPILDGKSSGFADVRLEKYRVNQAKIPSIAGKVIPEQAFSEEDYYNMIFSKVIADIRPYDPEGVLSHHFLNSRGAIARFDRGAIEIRIIDIQECPKADLAVLTFIVTILKELIKGRWSTTQQQQTWHEDKLSEIFLAVIKKAEKAEIQNDSYATLFGFPSGKYPVSHILKNLFNELRPLIPTDMHTSILHILHHGTLSTRITQAVGPIVNQERIALVYRQLASCLENNQMFG